MASYEPQSGSWVQDRHDQAKEPWNTYLAHIAEVEEVWTGDYSVPSDLAEPELEIAQPSEAYALISKMMKLMAIRSEKRYEVPLNSDTSSEHMISERLERFCRAYMEELKKVVQKDAFHDGAFYTMLRGRGAFHSIYEPRAKHPKIRIRVYDGAEYFPVYGDDGVAWFTLEREMTRWELLDRFDSMGKNNSLKQLERKGITIPELRVDDDGEALDLSDELTVLQYWDDDYFAWTVDGHMVQKTQHKLGRVTLRETLLNRTPLEDRRYRCEPFIGPVVNALKMKAALKSKVANSVETFYYPLIATQNENNQLVILNPRTIVGEAQNLAAGSKIEVISPTANDQQLQLLMGMLNDDINKATLSEVAFATEITDVSGFRGAQVLNIIKDDISDVLDQMQDTFGQVMGDVFWLHQKFAPKDGWEYPMMEPNGKRKVQRLTAEDFDGHHRVYVTVKPALPQDLVQSATIAGQLWKRDPMTGELFFDKEAASEVSGLSDAVGEMSAMNDRIEKQYLIDNDEAVRALHIEHLKAKHYPELRDMERNVQKVGTKKAKQEAKDAEKAIDAGMSQDLVIPADVLADPYKMHQLASLIEQGMMPQQALDVVMQGTPLGMPGEPVAEGMGQPEAGMSPEAQQIMASLQSQGPTGLTGYEGINPMVSPPAMQGAQPRRVVDQSNVQVEDIETTIRRGAKPPAR